MCGADYADIKAAREQKKLLDEERVKNAKEIIKMNETECPECHLPLADHPVPDDLGFKILYGNRNEIVNVGDILSIFDSRHTAADFAKNPWKIHPRDTPLSRTMIVGGLAGKTLDRVASFLNDGSAATWVFSDKIVIMRPNPKVETITIQADKKVPPGIVSKR